MSGVGIALYSVARFPELICFWKKGNRVPLRRERMTEILNFSGLYRALSRPGMSVVLTVVFLGTRVGLAYALSAIPAFGVVGIWWSVPIGWFLVDAVGIVYYGIKKEKLAG